MTDFGYGLPAVDTAVIDANAVFVLQQAGVYFQESMRYVGDKAQAFQIKGLEAALALKDKEDKPEQGIIHVIEAF